MIIGPIILTNSSFIISFLARKANTRFFVYSLRSFRRFYYLVAPFLGTLGLIWTSSMIRGRVYRKLWRYICWFWLNKRKICVSPRFLWPASRYKVWWIVKIALTVVHPIVVYLHFRGFRFSTYLTCLACKSPGIYHVNCFQQGACTSRFGAKPPAPQYCKVATTSR